MLKGEFGSVGLPVAHKEFESAGQGISHVNVWNRGSLRYIWNQVDLVALQALIGVFEDDRLLIEAMVHPSALPAIRYRESELVERPSFRLLGKCVVREVVRRIIPRFYHRTQGTRDAKTVREVGTSPETLSTVAESLGLDSFIVLGRPLSCKMKSDATLRERTIASVFESLLGAIARDQGFERARSFLMKIILPVMSARLRRNKPPITRCLRRWTEPLGSRRKVPYGAYPAKNLAGADIVRIEIQRGRCLVVEEWETADLSSGA